MPKSSFLSLRKEIESLSSSEHLKSQYVEENLRDREQSIELWYRRGGQFFLDWAKEHYAIFSGEKLRWDEVFLEDYYRVLGEPKIRDAYIQKGSQVGYTESLIAFSAFFLACLKLPIGFGFEEWTKQRDMVATRIQLAFSHCKPIRELNEQQMRLVGRKDMDTRESITVGGVKASFFYAGKNSATTNDISRQASSRLSSFSACGILADEVELWSKGVLDVSRRRMDASILPNQILRAGSTPGHEGGLVDSVIKSSDYIFQWHVLCPHCDTEQALDPFGNLLKAKLVEEGGQFITKYLDRGGRPLDWFFSDANYRKESAYIGCSHCDGILTYEEIRWGEYKCILTGKTLHQLFDELRLPTTRLVDRVAIRLPKLGLRNFNAPDTIKELFETQNPADAVQQGLGLPFSLGSGKIQLEILLECVGLPLPEQVGRRGHDLIVMGVDQGKYCNSVIIQRWTLGDEPSKELKWRNAHKEVIWWGGVDTFDQLKPLIDKYNVLIIGIDSEPEWGLASEYCFNNPPKGPTVISLGDSGLSKFDSLANYDSKGKFGGVISGLKEGTDDEKYWTQFTAGMNTLGQVYLIDQVNFDKAQYKRNLKNIKSHDHRRIPVFAVDRTFWLDAVRDRLYARQTHFPEGTTYDPKNNENLLYHYVTSDRLILERKWVEAQGTPDHFFHADSFCEAAMFMSMFETGV